MQDKFITLNAIRLHFLDWGNENAPPLVLLHGFSTHAHFWDIFARAIRDRFHVLSPDARGHGESEWADDYSPARMLEDLDAFVNMLGQTRVALCGFSMGARTCYLYAAQHPDKVERLIIVDMGPDIMRTGAQRTRNEVLAQEHFDDPDQVYQAARAANPRPSDQDLRNRVMHNMMRREDGRWTWRYDKALRAPNRRFGRDPAQEWATLSKIECPALVVRSTESDILSHETAEQMARAIPNCKSIEVGDCGHSIPTDNPDGFIAAVRPFLLEEINE